MGVDCQATTRPLYAQEGNTASIVPKTWWKPEAVWTDEKNFAFPGIRSPDLPTLGQQLYRLRNLVQHSRYQYNGSFDSKTGLNEQIVKLRTPFNQCYQGLSLFKILVKFVCYKSNGLSMLGDIVPLCIADNYCVILTSRHNCAELIYWNVIH